MDKLPNMEYSSFVAISLARLLKQAVANKVVDFLVFGSHAGSDA